MKLNKSSKIWLIIFIIFLIVIISTSLVLIYKNIKKDIPTVSEDTNVIDKNSITSVEMQNTVEEENIIKDTNTVVETEKYIEEKKQDNGNAKEEKGSNTKQETKKQEQQGNNNKTQEIKNNNNQSTQKDVQENKTQTTENVKTESNKKNEKLANTTYTKVNTQVVPEIIKILEDEIRKHPELVEYGTKAMAGNKSEAYKNTHGFTYLFVKDIEKGKISGNYVTFAQRVRNNVGAFGTYCVYAEDEYVYDSKGLKPRWSQTLVWIYIKF